VLVRNLSNDRVVVAKVTDRGPYHGKRILDIFRDDGEGEGGTAPDAGTPSGDETTLGAGN